MKCISCGQELTEDMFVGGICFSCGTPIKESEKVYNLKLQKEEERQLKEHELEKKAEIERKKVEAITKIKNHKVTTGYNFEKYEIIEYLGLVSGESVIGTGWFSSFEAGVSDLLGIGSYAYSEKIRQAKEESTADMVQQSINLGGNAVIGISFEITTFSGDMIGVSTNGTSVKIQKKNE